MPSPFEQIRFAYPGLKRPSGPARAGLLTAAAVGVIPLVATLLLALLAGVVVYAVTSAAARLLGLLGIEPAPRRAPTAAPPGPERENVRVRRPGG